MKLFPPQALLARLDQRLAVLTGTSRDVRRRQQTLRNTIAWSYNLLDAAGQRLFRRLSVFVGGCTLEAVEAVCAAGEDGGEAGQVLERVASLIDKSLVQQTEQEGEEPRLLMLETIREYGLEILAASGEMEITQQAHALYYLRLSEEGEPELAGPRQAIWLERLERALSRSDGVAASVRAKALFAATRLNVSLGYLDRAEALCEESLALYRELGDTAGIASSLHLLAAIAWGRGNLILARSQEEESFALFKEVGDKRSVASALVYLGNLVIDQGEYTRARSLLEESLEMNKELGDTTSIADSLFILARLYYVSQGDLTQAHTWLEESLALYQELGDKESVAYYLYFSGLLALAEGATALAYARVEQAVAHFQVY